MTGKGESPMSAALRESNRLVRTLFAEMRGILSDIFGRPGRAQVFNINDEFCGDSSIDNLPFPEFAPKLSGEIGTYARALKSAIDSGCGEKSPPQPGSPEFEEISRHHSPGFAIILAEKWTLEIFARARIGSLSLGTPIYQTTLIARVPKTHLVTEFKHYGRCSEIGDPVSTAMEIIARLADIPPGYPDKARTPLHPDLAALANPDFLNSAP
jgi:hypothetical protein